MHNTSKLKKQLEIKKERRDYLERESKTQRDKLYKIESRSHEVDILEEDKYKNAITDSNQRLVKIHSELDPLHDEIETLERELKQISNSTFDNKAGAEDLEEDYPDDYVDEEVGTEDFGEDNYDDVNENELSVSVNFRDFNNLQQNYYSSRLEELRKYEKSLKTSNTSNENIASKSIQAVELIRTEDSIKKTVLYVATFFPKLSNQDFERIVSFLLEEKSVTVIVPFTEVNEKGEYTKNLYENKNLYSIWKEDGAVASSKIMEECHLRSVRLEDYTKVVDFKLSYLRNDLKTYFQDDPSSYLERQFQRSKMLLFDHSIAVVKNAIELSIEMAKDNPKIHGGQWLVDILNLFRLFTNFQQLTVSGFSTPEVAQLLFSDKPRQEEFKLFARFISQVDEKYRGEFLISRVAFLIQRMLDYTNLKPYVNSFIQEEINTQNQDTVLVLITLLQSVPAFDWLSWVEKLLNEKSALIGSHTRQILFSQLKQSQNKIYDILTKIRSWLSKEQLKRSDYSQSQVFALRLIYKYSRTLYDELKSSDYGCYPPKYQLFDSLGDGSTNEKLKFLVEWVFHPGHKNFVKAPIKEASRLIADWFAILHGLDEKQCNSKSQALANKLLLQVITTATTSQRSELRKCWNEQTQILLREANKPQNTKKGSLQKNLMQKRETVIKLIEQFVNLQQSVRT